MRDLTRGSSFPFFLSYPILPLTHIMILLKHHIIIWLRTNCFGLLGMGDDISVLARLAIACLRPLLDESLPEGFSLIEGPPITANGRRSQVAIGDCRQEASVATREEGIARNEETPIISWPICLQSNNNSTLWWMVSLLYYIISYINYHILNYHMWWVCSM